MLFPELGPQYYNERDKPMLSRMESFYAESITINQSFWSEADTDFRFWAGDQTVWSDIYGNLPASRRRQFNFNRIRRVVNMISGHQRRTRKSIIATPIENADNDTADQFTKVLMWVNQREHILETVSDAFESAVIGGMSFLHVWLDYRTDPVNGNIKVDKADYNSFLVDPYFKRSDMSDCNSFWKRSFVTKREAVSLLPDYTDEILALQGNESGTGRDGKFQFQPESYNYGYKNLLTYDEFYYRDYRPQKLLVDSQTGETMEWRSSDKDRLREYLDTYPEVTLIEHDIPTVRLAIVVQGKVIYDGPQPLGIDRYPVVPVMCYYAPQLPYYPSRLQGICRGLRDSQYLYNRRKSIELDILESQINSGWVYKENALVNPKDVWNVAGQGRGLALKSEAQMTDVQQIQAPQIPPSMIELSKILAQEIQEISGVSEELLGAAQDDIAGVLSRLRQGASLTTLQTIFDHLDHSQKLLGEIMIEVIQANWTPGKIKKILSNEEPSEQFYNKAFGTYGAVVADGLNTDTQKQMYFAQLLQLREAGVPIPDETIIEAATIQDKKKLISMMQQTKQQAEQQQQAASQMQMAEAQSRIDLAKARAIADEGLGQERYSRIEENKALAEERRAAAVKDEEVGLLNLVRAMKEIEGIDIGQIEKLVTLAQLMRANEDTLKDTTSEAQNPKPAPTQQENNNPQPAQQPVTQQVAEPGR